MSGGGSAVMSPTEGAAEQELYSSTCSVTKVLSSLVSNKTHQATHITDQSLY